MYTQCPHCLTLFRVSHDEMKIAAGKVKCCQCQQVFNAMDNLRQFPASAQSPDMIETWEDSFLLNENFSLNLAQGDDDDTASTTQSEINPESKNESFTIMDDGLETEPDYLAGGSESQMSELLGGDSTPLDPSSEDAKSMAKVVSLHQHMDSTPLSDLHYRTDFPLQEPTHGFSENTTDITQDKPLFRFTQRQKAENGNTERPKSNDGYALDDIFEKQGISFSDIAWGLGSLALVLVIAWQLAWHYKEWTIQHEWGRIILSQVCEITGCTTPQRRDTSQILIQHRDLRSHPEKPNALLLQLSMVNHAEFAQPYPKLQLSLTNEQHQLVALRIFEPTEYLSDPRPIDELMPQSEPVFVSMELLDPGKDVTGFEFEFL